MDNIYRRKSGVYFVRLVVPTRLRVIVGKTELLASTGVRDHYLAKIVGAEVLAVWRRRFLNLAELAAMDIIQLKIGSPALSGAGLLKLRDAAAASGIDVDSLLRYAIEKRLHLYHQPGMVQGFIVRHEDLDLDFEELGGGMIVPVPSQMPESAVATHNPGSLRLYVKDTELVGPELIAGNECQLVLFELPNQLGSGFAPTGGIKVSRNTLSVAVAEIESLRRGLAARITPEQLAESKFSRAPKAVNAKTNRHVSEAVVAFMIDRGKSCSADQARRIHAACKLFVELMRDPRLCDIDRDLIRHYKDVLLPTVPANENKIRLQYRTTTIRESIDAVAGSTWPRISLNERTKRVQWLCGLFEWLLLEKWIQDDPAAGLGSQSKAQGKSGNADHSKRDLFTKEEFEAIFGATWFKSGQGKLTKKFTYREFSPYYYWLPLLGMYTGARINELCQLSMSDIRKTDSGVWYFDINDDDENGRKKIKNSSSKRKIPVHSCLIRLGLIEWRDRLEVDGHTRLFPELLYDPTKGYSKAAVKWFSGYLKRLGWERDGRSVFHSFRHTLSTECMNVLGLSEATTAQISGHKRSQSVLGSTYRKDVIPDQLVKDVERLNFQLPKIAKFDVDAGLIALRDALKRKK